MSEMADKLAISELRYLIFKVGSGVEIQTLLTDAISITNKLSFKLIMVEGTERRKIQNIMKQVDIVDIVINKLMKRLYYDSRYYKKLYSSVFNMLYEYSYRNPNTQLTLKPHLSYLQMMMEFDLPVCKIIGQIISQERQRAFG